MSEHMSGSYAAHYTPHRIEVNRYCHGCDRLIRRGQSCWLDDRDPTAVVCGRCVMADPDMHQAAVQPPARPDVRAGELDGQTAIELS